MKSYSSQFRQLRELFKVGNKSISDSKISNQVNNLPGELGYRPNPENRMQYLYRLLWVDSNFRNIVLSIRDMDRKDPRCKRIHRKTSTVMTKSGLRCNVKDNNKRVLKIWDDFSYRLGLGNRAKLMSDASGYIKEGNLFLQWVLGADNKIWNAVRMPSETMIPDVSENGIFKDIQTAYHQLDAMTSEKIASFPLWQISHGRLDPDNYDDLGCMGRPMLDAAMTIFKKMTLTDEDLVIRRHDRAPSQKVHVLEGATEAELEAYKNDVEQRRKTQAIDLDYFLNKKGAVGALQGDENLDQINDVLYLVDTFFTGAPAPKALFGYAQNISRDVLEDMKRDFFEEVDSMQDELSAVYQEGFELELLLNNIDPRNHGVKVEFNERVTETLNQATDRALKQQAGGASKTTVFETMGLVPAKEKQRLTDELEGGDPYPTYEDGIGSRSVKITPGNAKKKESATDVSNK